MANSSGWVNRYVGRLLNISRSFATVYVLVTAFILLASFYSVVVPPYEAPDEPGHFQYILHIHQTGALPVQQAGIMDAAHHPPLYYLIAALFSAPGNAADSTGAYRPNPEFMWRSGGGEDVNIGQHRTAETFPYRGHALILHLSRLTSVLMGAGTVFFVFLIGRKLFPQIPEIGGLAAALVAFNPQFLFISSVINNDNLLTLAATGLCFQLLCVINDGVIDDGATTRHWFYAALWLSVAVLAKVNGALFVSVMGLWLVVQARRHRSAGYFFTNGALIGATVLVLCGWWFWRNWQNFNDLLGWSIYTENFAVNLRQAPLTLNDLRHFRATQFNSFWGRFGWMNIWSPEWFYSWIRGLIALAAAGGCLFLVRKWRTLTRIQWQMLATLALFIVLYQGYILWAITKFNDSWYQGRYIFPVIGPLMVLMGAGTLAWIHEKARPFAFLVLSLVMACIALYMPLSVIAPAYQSVTQPKWQAWLLPNKTEYRFGELILLRGYEIEQEGSRLLLNLTWQALQKPDFNYSAFVHLLDPNDTILTQQDRAPGESVQYPPAAWEAEDIVVAQYTLEIPNGDPSDLRFRVGLYNWESGERLPVLVGDEFVGDHVILE